MIITLIVILVLMGLAVGSFLNVSIDRVPAKKSLAYPSSHCDACQHPLSITDNIPLFSYIFLRGKCRYCGAHIPIRVFWMELLTGILFGFMYWYYGLTWQFGITTLYSCVLLVLAIIDIEQGLLPNRIVYPMAIIAFIINVITPAVIADSYAPHNAILKSLAGGGTGLAIFIIIALIFRAGMGWGDVKLVGLIGLMTGFPRIFPAILIGIVLGGLIALLLVITKIRGRKQTIPFGPFLSVSGLVVLLWGNQIIHWYLKFFTK